MPSEWQFQYSPEKRTLGAGASEHVELGGGQLRSPLLVGLDDFGSGVGSMS